jgi:hypothetical protein
MCNHDDEQYTNQQILLEEKPVGDCPPMSNVRLQQLRGQVAGEEFFL